MGVIAVRFVPSILLCGLTLLGASCGQRESAPVDPKSSVASGSEAASASPRLYLDTRGIELIGDEPERSRLVAFGAREAEARAAIERVTGNSAKHWIDPECRVQPNSRLEYLGNLYLKFEGGNFVGWEQQGPGYSMRNGIANNVDRRSLEDLGTVETTRVEVSPGTLEEFTSGAISGMIEDGRVMNFSAGRSVCW